jgi:hypothetical protein
MYNRALSATEIAAIYNAGSAGKCTSALPPLVHVQPASQTAPAGNTAIFTVGAGGTQPLSYQWIYNGNPIAGATSPSLGLTNVQTAQAGNYSVQVTNIIGSITSAVAVLTVGPPPPCDAPPANLISWWQAEWNASDAAGANIGSLVNGVTFGPGVVGQAFAFNGNGSVQIPDSPSLNLTNELTLELWYKDTGSIGPGYGLIAKRAPYPQGASFGINLYPGSYGLQVYLQDPNYPSYQVSGYLPVPQAGIFHHVAATYAQATSEQVEVKTYVDGQLVKIAALSGNLARCLNSAPVTIGASNPSEEFLTGLIDEPTIYGRALSAGEILAIYNAGISGKCPTAFPATIYSQPTNQTLFAGQTAIFTVGASGTQPLSYLWSLNGTAIPGATNATLTLTNIQIGQAGAYTVQVSNVVNSVLSSQAVLTVNPPPPCVPPSAGLVSWWRAEGDATDFAGVNNGTLNPATSFAPGKVGQAFSFNGPGSGVELGVPANLQIQDFSIEAWVKRGSSTKAGWDVYNHGLIVSWAWGGFGLGMYDSGQLFLAKVGYSGVSPSLSITDATDFHHVAVTKSGSNVVFYLDGVAEVASGFDPGFVFNGTMCVGTRGSDHVTSFDGLVDEASVYSRALSATEVQAIYSAGSSGKCAVPIPPSVSVQPGDQTVSVGDNAMFSIGAAGTAPLSYQWNFNGNALIGATNSALSLTNVQRVQAGIYSVLITNAAGSILSSNATLTVNFPPAPVLLGGGNVAGGGLVSVPILIIANGNENALGFSLDFPPSLLTYTAITLGAGASGATLVINTNQVGSGTLGVLLSLGTGLTLPPGTQELAEVTFLAAALTNASIAQLSFGDQPTRRQISDVQANPLPATYGTGTVSIDAADFEGDVTPRPNGDKIVSVTDWVLEGRYAAKLDYPTNASEYQRADCAPRDTLGDGAITVADWVQVGRYAAGLDPMTVAGGPTNDVGPNIVSGNPGSKPPADPSERHSKGLTPRQLKVSDASLAQGQSANLSVYLEAQGNENAVGFTLAFDPAVFTYAGAALGADSAGATLEINPNQAAAGRLAFALALPIGTSFATGTKELVKVTLRSSASAVGIYPVALSDQPVQRQIVDPTAASLLSSYLNASVTINPPPVLTISRSPQSISLSWPSWANNFVLQQADGPLPTLAWTNVSASIVVTNNASVVKLPLTDTTKFYRLQAQ